MCGIAGILSQKAPLDCAEKRLEGLVRALHHRGPDDAGKWKSADSRVGLGATRLAMVGLRPGGQQPMSTQDGRYTMVFNGEIYNFRALRDELSASGYSPRSQSDTEVVLELYAREGPACLSKLRGMFAFA